MRPKKVILLVDDNEQELSVLKFMLETNGYLVIEANSGNEAIEWFAEARPDLVLANFAMPHMNGTQLINRLKQIASYIPMILLCDLGSISGTMHSADAAIDKRNCTPSDLLQRIKIMAARKRGPRKQTAGVRYVGVA